MQIRHYTSSMSLQRNKIRPRCNDFNIARKDMAHIIAGQTHKIEPPEG